jgi:hypothetical protein
MISNIDPVLMVRLKQVVFETKVTLLVPVVAITTLSPLTGKTPPTQVVLRSQLPPVDVLVLVEALTFPKEHKNKTINSKQMAFDGRNDTAA